ncbi:hypothetical protein VTK56DRAFT_7154 [Thermocarpiscus australiensis]
MTQPQDHLTDLDRHVQQLESKVNQLRASLSHWQQWYLEYSTLKEEVEQLPRDPPPHEALRRIRRDFDSKLLSKKEINEILGKHDLKEPEQIVNVLSRRMDYVEQNIGTLTKLLEKEENRLAAASVVAHPDAGTDEESGLPITDIIEELDDDDNVVNFRLQRGGDAEPKIVEALRKAGIHDLPETEADLPQNQKPSATNAGEDEVKQEPPLPDSTATPSPTQEDDPGDERSTTKKTVSFAEDTKPGHDASEPPRSRAAQTLERLMEKAREQEAMDMSSAVIPDNESPEDSQLRREMLAYSMSEIGPVVAELQLEEDYSGDDDDADDFSWDGSDAEYEDEDVDDDDDDEDELGRSKRSVITPDYIKRMQELEKRLGTQSAFSVARSESKPKKSDEGIGRIAVVGESGSPSAPPTAAPREKKRVSFASKLDIAPEPAPQPALNTKPKPRPVAHVGEVVEKTPESGTLKEPEEPPKRVSRFRKEATKASTTPSSITATSLPRGPHQLPASFVQARAIPPVEPNPPDDQTLANTVVERPVAPDPSEPDEMDATILYKEAAVEYNRLRNQLIRKQGGVVQQAEALDPESGLVPLDEELGGPKRVSKFKAAQLTKLR